MRKQDMAPLTPEEIERCLAARPSSGLGMNGKPVTWRRVADKLKLSPHRVMQHFSPSDLAAFRDRTRTSKRRQRMKLKDPKPPIPTADMDFLIRAYRRGMSISWASERAGPNIGRTRIEKVFATLELVHGSERRRVMALPKTIATPGVLRPARTRTLERKEAHCPPAHVIADRDRRANLRYQSSDPNVLLMGDPVR